MIVDLAALDGRELAADVCVVGAGAAGLAIVSELLGSGARVVVLESGHEPPAAEDELLDEGEVVEPYNGLGGRARGLGGTMRLWPGQCRPLEPEDLAPRPWIPASGWPIEWDELARWYAPACAYFGVPADVFERDVFRMFRLRAPSFDRAQLAFLHGAFSPLPDRSRPLRPKLRAASDVTVVTGATAVTLVADESRRRVERVLARSLGGRSGSVAARHVVLCCGGIENPRLLLASGIGNEHDVVGRYLQDHVATRAGTIAARDVVQLQTVFGVLYRRRLRYYPRLALAPAAQRAQHVLACGANVVFEADDGGVRAAVRLARGLRAWKLPPGARADAAHVLRGAGPLAAALVRRYARGWSPARRSAQARLLLIGEQSPNRDSRITLADSVDPLGVPKPRVEWKLTELERRTLETTGDAVARELRANGLGELELDPRLRDPAGWREAVFDSFHHMGGTRMASDPRHGVVDEHCRVHGFANLFVAGSSVFPTSGFANPTLTIAALAIRLADRLKRVELRA